MISFHAALLPDQRPTTTIPDPSRKRNWVDVVGGEERPRPAEFKPPGSSGFEEPSAVGEARSSDAGANKRTCKEHELIATSTVGRAVSLNLELNLQPYDEDERPTSTTRGYTTFDEDPRRSPKAEAEMVAAVCGRCHMLVMLCVWRPCCPNCRFLNPKPDQTPFRVLPKPPSSKVQHHSPTPLLSLN